MRLLLIALAGLLTGCTSVRYNEEPYIVPAPPNVTGAYVSYYTAGEVFYGYEGRFSLPFMRAIPVVGQYLSDIIQVRSGAVRPVISPVYTEKVYEAYHPNGRNVCHPGTRRLLYQLQSR